MTNEELVIEIQAGKTKLLSLLWDNVKALFQKKANAYYMAYIDACQSCGVTSDDIVSECYFGFLDAIKVYKPDGCQFSSYLSYAFKNACNALMGLRTSRTRNEPLNHCISLNESLDSSQSDYDTLLEIIPCDNSLDFLDELEQQDDASIIRNAVNKLPELYRNIIQKHFFENRELTTISQELGVSCERVRQYKQKALRELRRNPAIKALWIDTVRHNHWTTVSHLEFLPEYYNLCQALREKPLSYGYRQAELYRFRNKQEQA